MLIVRIFLNEKAVKISHYMFMFTLKNKNRQTSKTERERVRKGDSSVCAGGPIYTMSCLVLSLFKNPPTKF